MSDSNDKNVTQLIDEIRALSGRISSMESIIDRQRRAIDSIARRHEPFGVYVGNGTILTQMMTGLRFFIPAGDTVMMPKMVGNRVWEPRITSQLPSLLRRERDVVDVGANVGYFSVTIAQLIGRDGGGQVYAFEPNPAVFELLTQNVRINWSLARIHSRQVAIGASEGEMTLHLPGELASNATLLSHDGNQEGIDTVPVKVLPLSRLIRAPEKVGLIKIDVEGAERMVVQGATEMLRSVPDVDIIMEWDVHAQSYDPGAAEWLAQFYQELGYRAYIIESDMASTEVGSLPKLDYCNLFLTRRSNFPKQ